MIVLRQNTFSIEEGHYTGNRSYRTPGNLMARHALITSGLGAVGGLAINAPSIDSGKEAAITAGMGAVAGLAVSGISELIDHIIRRSRFNSVDVNNSYTSEDLIRQLTRDYGSSYDPTYKCYTVDRNPKNCHINLKIKDGTCVIILNNPSKLEYLAVNNGLDKYCSLNKIADYKATKVSRNITSIELPVLRKLESSPISEILRTEECESYPDFKINILTN